MSEDMTHIPLDYEGKQVLLKALEQNWEHARHQENQRQTQLSIFIAVFGGILAFISQNFVAMHSTLMRYWPIFLFLAIFSMLNGYNIAKWNLEFKNHISAIQWISERLGLIQNISAEKKGRVMNSELKTTDMKTALLADSTFQGYMGLPMPLAKRAHEDIENIVDFLALGTSAAFLAGLLMSICDFFSFQSWLDLGGILPPRTLAYGLGLVFGISIVAWNRIIRKQMNVNTIKLLAVREPDDVSIHYRKRKNFYEKEEMTEEDRVYYVESRTTDRLRRLLAFHRKKKQIKNT